MKKNSVRWAKKQWDKVEARARHLSEEAKQADEMERALTAPKRLGFTVALHTADPLSAKRQEASYAGYARLSIERSEEELLTGKGLDLEFPQCIGGPSQTITHIEVQCRDGSRVPMQLTGAPIYVSTGMTVKINNMWLKLS